MDHANSGQSSADDIDERAAVIEFGARAPRAWAEALTELDPNRPPLDVPLGRWVRFLNDCGQFLDCGWAQRAVALGWGPVDLFGCDRHRPFARIDQAGLLWLLNGHRLVALTNESAIIELKNGVRQTYRRRRLESHASVAWELDERAPRTSIDTECEI